MEYFLRSRERILTLYGIPGVIASLIRALAETPYSFEKALGSAGRTLLPFLILYLATYFLNRALIRRFAKKSLLAAQRRILTRLVDAALSAEETTMDARDLLEEEAWQMLRDWWRSK